MPETDISLWDWRYGQTQAERLCADLLQVEGFSEIDPQCPLGGPDDRKDILCVRERSKWVGAVYFPPTRQKFKDVKDKFNYDFKGVERHKADAFVFLTNQQITPGERAELVQEVAPVPCEVYHQERIRSLLDSPKGYGFRLEYLRIPMTLEEQQSLWSTLKDDITIRLTQQESQLLDLHRKIDIVLERTMDSTGGLTAKSSSMLTTTPKLTQFPTADLQTGHILWIHRIVQDGSGIPAGNSGRFRNVSVWIGKPGSTQKEARFTPPSPEEVPSLLNVLLERWHSQYKDISSVPEAAKIKTLADFHHDFLSIHPFLDGNGRVARVLLQQQAFELTGRYIKARFTEDPATYYDALFAADKGHHDALINLIKANLD